MSNSYRIRTTVGSDKSIKVRIDQDFEHLEILSLKILQNEVYTRQCSDYGVVVGRVSINNGFGIPNAKVSVFIPLSDDDEVNNPILASLYPYKTLTQFNDEGYRYNLLPKEPSHSNHVPTGTFFTREEVLTNPVKFEIYDKYYKLNSITNDSGDFMIFGVPLGSQTIVVNVDLSDIGDFSVTPQDLIRMGVASPQQVGGTQFNSSNNFNQLPQIITINRTIEVQPFWGDENICVLGITRTDFDLSAEKNIVIQPTAVFMGSLISTTDESAITRRCDLDNEFGNQCSLVAGPGQISAIRQTIFTDVNGRPGLELARLEDGGQVIDENGTWVIDVPMNLDYVTTNEFGEQVISNDPKVGIPTKGKYRFKIKWNQSPDLGQRIKRASYLVPNIKEYGWSTSNGIDPYTGRKVRRGGDLFGDDNPCVFQPSLGPAARQMLASYAFSLDWEDYGEKTGNILTPLGLEMVNEAITCEDRFYEMRYNKVYTVSQLFSEYRKSGSNLKFMGIKHILDESCDSVNNRFPVNDAVYRPDALFILFQIMMLIIYALMVVFVLIQHILTFVVCSIIKPIVKLLKEIFCRMAAICIPIPFISPWCPFGFLPCGLFSDLFDKLEQVCRNMQIKLPMMTYPDCELCACEAPPGQDPSTLTPPDPNDPTQAPPSPLGDLLLSGSYPAACISIQNSAFITGIVNNSANPPGTNLRAAPGDVVIDAATKSYFTSTDLPWFERINLFNVKAKYFDTNPDNPGGGVNRIAVKFDTDNNNGPLGSSVLPADCHLDNVVALLLDASEAGNYTVGGMYTFSNPLNSEDKNLTTDFTNEFGFNSITGSTLHDSLNGDEATKKITVKYANPAQSAPNFSNPEKSVNYTIKFKNEITHHKFPIDLEYFQVIHNVSIGEFNTEAGGFGFDLFPNSFYERFLNGKYQFFENRISNNPFPNNPYDQNRYWQAVYGNRPVKDCYDKGNDLRVVFLVRGVDPNSPKVNISYDLSRLYGQKTWGKKVVTLNGVRMNVPIQGSYKCTKHNLFPDSSVKDAYSKSYLFYDTFVLQPSITSPVSKSPYDPSTCDYDPNTGDPINCKPYNPITDDPNYKPANAFSFKPFVTKNIWNYSQIDGTTFSQPNYTEYKVNFGLIIKGNSTLTINGNGNAHAIHYVGPQNGTTTDLMLKRYLPADNDNSNNRGYFPKEIVDGGNVSILDPEKFSNATLVNIPVTLPPTSSVFTYINKTKKTINGTAYYSITYESFFRPGLPSLNITSGISKRQIVMRSDRLPSSSSIDDGNAAAKISFTLMGNSKFSIYSVSDDGSFAGGESENLSIGTGAAADNAAKLALDKCGSNIASTFTCENLVPLKCFYTAPDGTTKIHPKINPIGDDRDVDDGCYGNGIDKGSADSYGPNPQEILKNGCYRLVTVPFLTLPLDWALLAEWRTRFVISYAACRGIFSHAFTNNWVNGTLFTFAFSNSRRFTPPSKLKSTSNKPYNCFCKNSIVFTPSNNFYYRSSPFSTTNGFVGRKAPVGPIVPTPYGNNQNNLMWPTTIMDLGPRDKFTQEIVSSNEYDGYVVDKLSPSTYQDVTELLNLFLVSRLLNKSFLDTVLNIVGTSAVFRYFSRDNLKVDGDYAQSISNNSELGTLGYSEDNYTTCDVYLSRGDSGDGVYGILFKTDNQLRDYITPKRTIINETALISDNNSCSLEYFPVKTQTVPLYQWFVQFNNNEGTEYSVGDSLKLGGNNFDSIYGSQVNDWFTEPLSGQSFFTYSYQKLDRIKKDSRYFRPKTPNSYLRRGLLSETTDTGTNVVKADVNNWDLNDNYGNGPMSQRIIQTGAPFYFYFGLLRGKTAFDKYSRKWLNGDEILD